MISSVYRCHELALIEIIHWSSDCGLSLFGTAIRLFPYTLLTYHIHSHSFKSAINCYTQIFKGSSSRSTNPYLHPLNHPFYSLPWFETFDTPWKSSNHSEHFVCLFLMPSALRLIPSPRCFAELTIPTAR